MESMQFYRWLLFGLVLLISISLRADARPASYDYGAERFDYDYYKTNSNQLTESNLRRLRRGYYYIDDGFITAVPANSIPSSNRRQDAPAGAGGNIQFTPLVKYKHTRTKRKKLFVPNLFG